MNSQLEGKQANIHSTGGVWRGLVVATVDAGLYLRAETVAGPVTLFFPWQQVLLIVLP